MTKNSGVSGDNFTSGTFVAVNSFSIAIPLRRRRKIIPFPKLTEKEMPHPTVQWLSPTKQLKTFSIFNIQFEEHSVLDILLIESTSTVKSVFRTLEGVTSYRVPVKHVKWYIDGCYSKLAPECSLRRSCAEKIDLCEMILRVS
ncbi:hypothetical protein TNCV_1678541 [Trichonephila clavipes]|nr:hypothetical protein TNCV_1678541 [Trichonephila clavipes]